MVLIRNQLADFELLNQSEKQCSLDFEVTSRSAP